MKRKVLVVSTINTDESGKCCFSNCQHKIYSDYCALFLTFLSYNYELIKYNRCAKCIKAEVG